MIIKYVSSFNHWLNEQAGWIRAIALPLPIATISIIILLSFQTAPIALSAVLFILYVFLLGFSMIVNYENTDFLDRSHNNRKIARKKLEAVSEVVAGKNVSLDQIIKRRIDEGEKKTRIDLLTAARFDENINRINGELFECLSFLLNSEREDVGNLYLSLLMPGKRYFDSPFRPWASSKSRRRSSHSSRIEINDSRTLIGQFHSENEGIFVSTDSTFRLSEQKKFHFFTTPQQEIIKSIFLYRIIDAITEETLAYWSLESDQEGHIPGLLEPQRQEEVADIFSLFSHYVRLEFTYSEAISCFRTELGE